MAEELGLNVRLVRYLTVVNYTSHRKLAILVECQIVGRKSMHPDHREIDKAEFFPLNKLPSDIHPAHEVFISYLRKHPKISPGLRPTLDLFS